MGDILKGKVAVVTGSGQGIGRAIAIGFAAQGAKVITNNRKPGSTGNALMSDAELSMLSDEKKEWYRKEYEAENGDAETTAKTIRDAGGEATAFFGDISKMDMAEQLIKKAIDTYGKIDILCNVAGNFGFSNLQDITEELWDKVNNTKPKGYFNAMKFAVPHMIEQKFGRIINCTSKAWMGDVLKHVEYCAANAGVVGLTRGAAMELYEYGITCNAFAPFARSRAAYELEAKGLVSDASLTIGGVPAMNLSWTPGPELLVPFLIYLASDAANKVSGSVFTLAGNSIQMHSEPVVCKSMYKEGGAWTPEELMMTAPRVLFGDYRSICEL